MARNELGRGDGNLKKRIESADPPIDIVAIISSGISKRELKDWKDRWLSLDGDDYLESQKEN